MIKIEKSRRRREIMACLKIMFLRLLPITLSPYST